MPYTAKQRLQGMREAAKKILLAKEENLSALPLYDGDIISTGLTKREYFAAMAPDSIPEWFSHESRKMPNPPVIEVPEHLQALCADWVQDSRWDLPESEGYKADAKFLSGYQAAWERYWSEKADWKELDRQSRYFQWRVFYANRLIAELNRPVE